MSDATLLLILLLLPFLGSVIAAVLPATARNREAWLAGAVALVALVITISLYPEVVNSGAVRYRVEWMPALGLEFYLRLDGFAWMFAMLVTGIGLLVVLYARYYMSPEDPVPRFFSFLLAFMGSMLGVVLSGNLIQLAFFWELTSLTSFLLIGYWHHNAAARDGARNSLIITGAGGLALFGGLLLLGHIVGSYELDTVLAAGDIIRGHPLYLPTLLLILLGALTKSAQFPFQFWLPDAMAAPTPVSAYLHSATMVKAGVFLLARLWPVLSGTEEWFWLVSGAGFITLLLGAYLAMFQNDLKGLLAYSTISHLGLITLLLGMSTPMAAVAAIFHIINHATFKASLFMAAGIIDHETGTRDMNRLNGLRHAMPLTATLAIVASAAMAGVPLMNGFLSKEMFFSEAIAVTTPVPEMGQVLTYGALIWGVFSVVYSLRFIHSVFFGRPATDLPRTPHEPPRWMRFPVELLVLACLLVGVVPHIAVGPYLEVAVRGVLGDAAPEYSLAVWHGFNAPLMMSIIAMVAGSLLYFRLQHFLRRERDLTPLVPLKGKRVFNRLLVFISFRMARTVEGVLGTRRLQAQLLLLVLVSLLLATFTLWPTGLAAGSAAVSEVAPGLALVWLVGGACAIGAAYQAKFHRLAALILLGGAGLAVVVSFVWFSAPDLAMTQLMVEIVTTVLLLLGLRWLPKRVPVAGITAAKRLRRSRDLLLAIVAGAGLGGLAYALMTRPLTSISGFFVDNAYTGGGGRNVVNVILVDFRGFDTFGEITVLGIVALTCFALLRRFRPAPESMERPHQQRATDLDEAAAERQRGNVIPDHMLVPSVIMRLLFPVAGAAAVYFLMRGHNLPGGGFVGGLILAIAIILQYMAGGTRWFEARLRINAVHWIAIGLILAAATGMGAWLFGHPFLTSATPYVDVPLLGSLPFASALGFDLGVFVLVVGATSLILVALAHQSLRSHRHSDSEREV